MWRVLYALKPTLSILGVNSQKQKMSEYIWGANVHGTFGLYLTSHVTGNGIHLSNIVLFSQNLASNVFFFSVKAVEQSTVITICRKL